MGTLVLLAERRGGLVELGDEPCFSPGMEGVIYPVLRYPELLAKIYTEDFPEKDEKLSVLLEIVPPNDSRFEFAWPLEKLRDRHGGLRGFVMRRCSGREIVELFTPKSRAYVCPNFDGQYLLRAAVNLTAGVEVLHSRGCIDGDFSPRNCLITSKATVALVDCDSFTVRSKDGKLFPGPMGTPEYMATERVNNPKLPRSAQEDLFGLPVLLWQLLLDGVHPFLGRNSTIEENIKRGQWPYRSRTVKPSPFGGVLEALHPKLQSLFVRAFHEGLMEPNKRPSAAVWRQTLEEVEAELFPTAQLRSSVPPALPPSNPPTAWNPGLWARTRYRIDTFVDRTKDMLAEAFSDWFTVMLGACALVLIGVLIFFVSRFGF